MNIIQKNIINIKHQIIETAKKYHRLPEDIQLLAVTKKKSCYDIQNAIYAGQYKFGENYAQEGIKKIFYFKNQYNLEWHFIGTVQTNKTKLVAKYFDWCHTIDKFTIAERLNKQRPFDKKPLNVLIQINITNEISKSGVMANNVYTLANKIFLLPKLKLRGLMAIFFSNTESMKQVSLFYTIEKMFQELKKRYPNIDTLSIGMTNDFDIAIAFGSTLLRIGQAIFGDR
ncbi:YggS family pyridoxal phosphate-dependent enzyme [Arsenophonus symbiont of Ornithomya chloropus]|uniref:YggS family pyridoxal phosphate-dependent enzyme n=1 Tax=Arsenophonus symbiont of Ornithomya chloropus TaxID=634121 RepID=UPI0032B1A698